MHIKGLIVNSEVPGSRSYKENNGFIRASAEYPDKTTRSGRAGPCSGNTVVLYAMGVFA
jgi:hypothetical protein